ncbi:LOW QUALITY PROTEIN: hypothetical protein TorRG33x02_312210 [Trema orientale]|uniref:Uncharacterized protein n=1 Tax=Trema orientale TaxID=63057 RepID=A0A2P5BQY8_TREOI|nr:LOW QUALITY PROTEIN: hypothetical protein TorRG33x02_312210 [Trema orientale]
MTFLNPPSFTQPNDQSCISDNIWFHLVSPHFLPNPQRTIVPLRNHHPNHRCISKHIRFAQIHPHLLQNLQHLLSSTRLTKTLYQDHESNTLLHQTIILEVLINRQSQI